MRAPRRRADLPVRPSMHAYFAHITISGIVMYAECVSQRALTECFENRSRALCRVARVVLLLLCCMMPHGRHVNSLATHTICPRARPLTALERTRLRSGGTSMTYGRARWRGS